MGPPFLQITLIDGYVSSNAYIPKNGRHCNIKFWTPCHDEAALTRVGKYLMTFHHGAETQLAIAAAREGVGVNAIETDARPIIGAEDFAFTPEARPGAMIDLGNGDTRPISTVPTMTSMTRSFPLA